ncbi:MAG: nitrous oxide reductase accessory protein NosL [Chromatiales bacterium]|nr:nitrous oxide reductase accessory protein NosL [Chromatiales bacterium]
MKRVIKRGLLIIFAAFVAVACNAENNSAVAPLSTIEAGESCHVCGMIVANFPGPKGQTAVKNREKTLKFCSTADLFTWLLQPETGAIVQQVYVHDMGAAGSSWEHPSDAHYVDVKQAWYVVGGDQMGAMGATLASFKEKGAAEHYMKQHGGALKGYDEINLELMANLNKPTAHQMPMSHGH